MTTPSPSTTTTASRPEADLASDLRITILRLSRKIRSEAGREDLSEAQYCVLAGLTHHGPTTPRALAERDGVQPPTMTRTIASLESAGLVARTGHPTDGRQVLIELTEKGAGVVGETRRLRNAWMDDLLHGLTGEERATLAAAVRILRQVADV